MGILGKMPKSPGKENHRNFGFVVHLGTSRLYRNSSENAKVQEENPRKTRGKSGIFMVFSWIFRSKPIPKPPENPSDHFEPVSASLDRSRPILHRFYILDFFLKKYVFFCFVIFLKYFLYFHCFWAPEAPGPLPNCRSHFSASSRGIETFWIPQNTSFMTKQCSHPERVFCDSVGLPPRRVDRGLED